MKSITVLPEKVLGEIDENIYGHFIEHLGRAVYGGVYDPESDLADKDGFRKDVIKAVKEINCPILRWPGGNFASNYHWKDGIGKKSDRPTRFDMAWKKYESNQFGTDEFMKLCQKIDTEPYLCVNIGTGTLDEAIHWLEYCNGPQKSYYGNLRKENGHPEPYNVKYWGIGNETYGDWQVGSSSAEEYIKKLKEFAKHMKNMDPSIKIIAVGADDPEWDIEVIKKAGLYIDYISNHQYHGSDSYYSNVAAAKYLERRLELLKSSIEIGEEYVKNHKKKDESFAFTEEKIYETPDISLDEWNIWHKSNINNNLEEKYTLQDALFAAGVFHGIFRLSRQVKMANLAQMVNVLGMIRTEKNDIYTTPIYQIFKLYTNHYGEKAVRTEVITEKLSCEIVSRGANLGSEEIPVIDACAALSKDNKFLYLSVINFHKNKDFEVQVNFQTKIANEKIDVWELNGADIKSINSFENPKNVRIHHEKSNVKDSYEFPAHSVTILKLKLE